MDACRPTLKRLVSVRNTSEERLSTSEMARKIIASGVVCEPLNRSKMLFLWTELSTCGCSNIV
jgi:hypothetical protein